MELLKRATDYRGYRRDVTALVWGNQCALIKNLGLLLERSSTIRCNLWFFDVLTGIFQRENIKIMYAVIYSRLNLYVLNKKD